MTYTLARGPQPLTLVPVPTTRSLALYDNATRTLGLAPMASGVVSTVAGVAPGALAHPFTWGPCDRVVLGPVVAIAPGVTPGNGTADWLVVDAQVGIRRLTASAGRGPEG